MNVSEIEKSIVQVFSDHVDRSYVYPWSVLRKYHSSGTGFCIEVKDYLGKNSRSEENKSKYIITNAHCVNNPTHVTVRKRGSSQLYVMVVNSLIDECDIAVLSIDEEFYKNSRQKKDYQKIVNSFWDDMPALHFGGIPSKLDKVFVYGYPLGGLNISITKGSVNRIQIIPYFNAVNGMAIQIDAAINFGNSGGPVINAYGEVVGVAFAGEDDRFTQNMGYVIPTPLIRFVISTLQENKMFKGLCGLGLSVQALNNSTLREYHGLIDHEGVLICDIEPTGPSKNILKVGDIITHIDGVPLRNDGTVVLKKIIPTDLLHSDEIVPYTNVAGLRKPGAEIPVQIVRHSKILTVGVKAEPRHFLAPILESQMKPSYYIVAGLVFVPISYMFINEKRQNKEHIAHLITAIETTRMSYKGEQIIVLSQIFHTELTEDYPENNDILDTVNGTKIINIEHLRKMVAAEIGTAKYLVFRFRTSKTEIIIKTEDYLKYHKAILEENINSHVDYLPS